MYKFIFFMFFHVLAFSQMVDFSEVADKAFPSVVSIEVKLHSDDETLLNKFWDYVGYKSSPSFQYARGSGFVVSSDGYIITNNHVVEGAVSLKVKLYNEEEYDADVIGTDPKTDLAVIKIAEKNLPFLTFSNLEDIRVGQWAVAIGNPRGLDFTFTAGIVSSVARCCLDEEIANKYIQTDVALNPGNSGGPLLNLEGEVIGVNAVIVSNSGGNDGLGFAISSDIAKSVYEKIMQQGHVERGNIGISVDNKLKITNVKKGSIAEIMGLQEGDILSECNGKSIKKWYVFKIFLSTKSPGENIALKVMRNNDVLSFDIPLDREEFFDPCFLMIR